MPKRLASWNPTRGIWETGVHDLLSEHSEPFSETWPASGMTRDGEAFELPTLVPRIPDTGCSSSRNLATPTAAISTGGAPDGTHGRRDLRRDLLPTPEAKLSGSGPDYARANRTGSGGDDLTTTVFRELLPTPSTADASGGHTRRGGDRSDEILLGGIADLLPTPVTTDSRGSRRRTTTGRSHSGTTLSDALLPTPSAMLPNDAEDPDDWWARWEYHANRTDQRPTFAGMPLAISAKLLARGDHSRLRFAGGKASSDE